MQHYHPLDTLQGYRLGSRQATVELQRSDVPGIQIMFKIGALIDEVRQQPSITVVLTGTAGDGKTYLAYQLIDALGLPHSDVIAAQPNSGYDHDGVFIDLDLSAGQLTSARVERLYQRLQSPGRCTLICVNEGKLAELSARFGQQGWTLSPNVRVINLSRRALAGTEAWTAILQGALAGPLWGDRDDVPSDAALYWNRQWLLDAGVADRLRRYLLLPYLLGEPITVRETLSFLAYALGGGRRFDSPTPIDEQGANESARLLPAQRALSYLLFNTVFGEPEGYTHIGRAVPTEKLLAWLFRFDPGDQASPETDLRLLVELDRLGVEPPAQLLSLWHEHLVRRATENTDVPYRERLARFMRYARRWYALASDDGFHAYFPFRHFAAYLDALTASEDPHNELIYQILRGINSVLSGGRETSDEQLQLFYLVPDDQRNVTIFAPGLGPGEEDFAISTDLDNDVASSDAYLEQMPRRFYLVYTPQPDIRLPVSLLLLEVLTSAASNGGFPVTLWMRERETVVRFMNALNSVRQQSGRVRFRIETSQHPPFDVSFNPVRKQFSID